jgi:RsiW-degrading membrane proteinase PrsW (M82 family)
MFLPLLNFKVILLVLAGGFLPSFLWLWFWLKEDRKNPEPRKIILTTFIAGGLSVFAAFYLERETTVNFDLSSLENARISFIPLWTGIKASIPLIVLFFGWALIEEFVKYLAAMLTAFRTKNFNEPVDAMIYMVTAALGFAAVENSLFLIKTLKLGMGGFDFLLNGNLRFFGATLLHIFSSAVVGAFIGLSFQLTGWRKIWRIILGVFVAALLHALFNFFIIINSGQNIFRVLIVLWILTIAVIILFEKIKKIKFAYVQR